MIGEPTPGYVRTAGLPTTREKNHYEFPSTTFWQRSRRSRQGGCAYKKIFGKGANSWYKSIWSVGLVTNV
jgi:hypothetical protein